MFEYLSGKIESISPPKLVLDIQGIGYALFVPIRSMTELVEGATIKLYVEEVVREPDFTLYGFTSRNDRELFISLIRVNGVGPKLALSLIGHLTLEDFQQIVLDEDLVRLSSVPGVGKRTSERLLVELKAKSKSWPALDHTTSLASSGKSWEAVQALMSLGYPQKDAEKAIDKVVKREGASSFSTSMLVTHALQEKAK